MGEEVGVCVGGVDGDLVGDCVGDMVGIHPSTRPVWICSPAKISMPLRSIPPPNCMSDSFHWRAAGVGIEGSVSITPNWDSELLSLDNPWPAVCRNPWVGLVQLRPLLDELNLAPVIGWF